MRVDPVVLNESKTLQTIVRALGRRLTFDDNIQSVILVIEDSGPADTPIAIQHRLGKVPTAYIANTSGGFVYDSNRLLWTDIDMELMCSAANSMLTLVIF